MTTNRQIKSFNQQLLSLLLLVMAVSLVGCSDSTKLSPLDVVYQSVSEDTGNTVTVNFCTDPAYNQDQYLKTVIILDHSGSNKNNYKMKADGSGAPDLVGGSAPYGSQYGTDIDGRTRYGNLSTSGTLLNYLSTLPANDPADPKRFFALVNFSSNAATFPAGAQGFTSDVPSFFDRVQQDSGQPSGTPNDVGSTNYLAALHSAYTIITQDIQAAKYCAALPVTSAASAACPKPGKPTASSYVVVFMSDGAPITNISGLGVDANGNLVVTGPIEITKQDTDEILSQTGTIAGLSSDTKFVAGVNFFTVYYYKPGNVDNSAQTLLSLMARVGNGVAYNALSGSNIDYNRFQPPTKRIRFQLKDIFVTNSSAAWNAGTLGKDSDRDGLSDELEMSWGSNPNQSSTFNNGVSDLVEYNYTNTATIQTPADYSSGICAGVANVNGTYQSSDPNGLNDCEKLILNNAGGINNPDSNLDLIPDWLQLKNSIPFQIGTAPALNTPDQDGYSLYEKIKMILPLGVPVSEMTIPKQAEYKVNLVSSTGSQDCYKVDVSNFPTVSEEDTVRVDIIMKSELLRENFLYRVGEKSFSPNSKSLIINDWTNATEQTANTWRLWE